MTSLKLRQVPKPEPDLLQDNSEPSSKYFIAVDLADKLKHTQDRLDLKRYELAEELRITPEWLSKIMRRRVNASEDVALRLAEVLRRRNLNLDSFYESSSGIVVEEPPAPFGRSRVGYGKFLPRSDDNQKVIGPSDALPPLPANPTSASDVRAYVELLLNASNGDPARLGRLLDTLREDWEITRQYWLKNPDA